MEKDTFVAHGASLLLKERFNSDSTLVPVCEKCGSVAVVDTRKNRAYCPLCGESTKVSNVDLLILFDLIINESCCSILKTAASIQSPNPKSSFCKSHISLAFSE